MHSTLLLAQTAAERGGLGGNTGPDLTWMATVVGILLVAIVGLAWGFRRLALGSIRTRASRRSLQVLDVLPLGGRRQLTVVRCYDRTFALGLGDKEVALVAELDPALVRNQRGTEQGDSRAEHSGEREIQPLAARGATPEDARQADFMRLLEAAKRRLARGTGSGRTDRKETPSAPLPSAARADSPPAGEPVATVPEQREFIA